MIALTAVSARSGGGFRRAASVLDAATLAWGRGVLAVLGTTADGTTALLDVLAGAIAPRRGRVDVKREGGGLARVVHVRAEPALPEGMRVSEIAALSAELFREQGKPVAERLAVLGVEHLADRWASSLTRAEARAVQLALALTAPSDVLLLEEPLAWLEAPAPTRVVHELRARAAATCIVVTTSSVRDATHLGDRVLVLTQGKLEEAPPGYLHVSREGGSLVVVLANDASGGDAEERAAAFVDALEASEAVAHVDVAPYAHAEDEAARAAIVTVTGPNLLAVADAVMRAAASARAPVEAIEPSVVPLEAVRAALAAARSGGGR